MIIGLTGKNAAGKGEVAEYLKKKGFTYFSLSDVIRDEAEKRKIEATRENLIKLGNELRKQFGSSVLVKNISEKITGNAVVDSIRNPEEIEELRKLKDFILLGVDAPVELRFKRAVERKRVGDGVTLKEFKQLEEKENFKNKANQQLNKCLEMADKIIINEGDLEDLHKKVEELLNEKA